MQRCYVTREFPPFGQFMSLHEVLKIILSKRLSSSFIHLFPFAGRGCAGANPSCHVLEESLVQEHMQDRPPLTHTHSHLRSNLQWPINLDMLLEVGGRRERTQADMGRAWKQEQAAVHHRVALNFQSHQYHNSNKCFSCFAPLREWCDFNESH